ncbi:DUF805 domain-containing protein [Frondihabitans australicus]|uniref:Uncharacterized membrane protein YhaH (DUF805 family) n=1 Tax=Frondihabitans australicus TaxID=386892 RepID=A0A495IJ87_9MICO|nr:DUF805 domain-containing protein [Frondihabitans australicus]RKR76043.1 uncharacterized membrane protein YhaH (DUF805 family) [Frondihabitans australicus]
MTYPNQPTEPPLEYPLYQATIGQAWTRVWRKYFTFSGRASRSEFWWWILVSYLVTTVLQTLVRSFGESSSPGAILNVASAIWALAILIPNLAVLWRRLHDANHSGFNVLWYLLPIVGWIILLVYTIQAPRIEGRRFDRAVVSRA